VPIVMDSRLNMQVYRNVNKLVHKLVKGMKLANNSIAPRGIDLFWWCLEQLHTEGWLIGQLGPQRLGEWRVAAWKAASKLKYTTMRAMPATVEREVLLPSPLLTEERATEEAMSIGSEHDDNYDVDFSPDMEREPRAAGHGAKPSRN
jgi:hypothetical protein